MKSESIRKEGENDRIEEIRKKIENGVIEMLDMDYANEDASEYQMKLQSVRTAMVYVRDREMMKRISQGQQIRVFNLISSDPTQLKTYIEATMPNTIPQIVNKG